MGRLTMKKKMFICFVLAALILVCVADYSQQKEYKKINSGYSHMYANEYDEAAEIFEAYLDAHSGIYWEIVEKFNGRSSKLTYDNVKSAFEYCKQNGN